MVVAFSIIVVLICIGLEYRYALKQGRTDIYNYRNTISNISVGIAERLIYLVMAPLFYLLFDFIYSHFSLNTFAYTWYNFLFLLLITDFVWYWYHRLGHRINLFWAAHIVHHQSEDFNFSVAARITIFQAYVRTLFWCVLPLIGFKPTMVLDVLLIHGTYSFFTHTQMIKRLGLLEHILITPSHHRVHHACNPVYLDKNYGDVFVFWDKLFGTFQLEKEPPVYGLTQPLTSYSFLWSHFHYYAELYVLAKQKKTLKEKIAVWFGPPEVMDPRIRPALERQLIPNRRHPIRSYLKLYTTIQILLGLILLVFVAIFYTDLNPTQICFLITILLLTLVITGAIIEQKRWVVELEVTRLFAILASGCFCTSHAVVFLALGLLVLAALVVLPYRKWYLRYVVR